MKVSVALITYNHERYIAQAIESVLMQQTNFDFDLVIGEDCSTDRTREIVQDFHQRYPEKIHLVLAEKNNGALQNIIHTTEACHGEYLAALEGDDCWISPERLQQQADFLDQHPDFAVCFGNARVFYEDRSRADHLHRPENQKEVTTLEDLIKDTNFIPSCTVMYRRSCVKSLPVWAKNLPMTDWLNNILAAQYGKIGYINKVYGAYRVHPGGIWSRLPMVDHLQADIYFYEVINRYFRHRYDKIIKTQIQNRWEKMDQFFIWPALETAQQMAEPMTDAIIFKKLRPEVTVQPGWKKKIASQVYPKLFFDSYQRQEIEKVRIYWWKAVRYSPSLLLNRGAWVIVIKSILAGRRTSSTNKR